MSSFFNDEFCYVFKKFQSLTKISIPSSIKEIDSYAFYELLKKLMKLSLSHFASALLWMELKFLKIEPCTFDGCTNLRRVFIPSTVTAVGIYAFYGCKKLGTHWNTSISGINWFKRVFNCCSSLTLILIQPSVTEIGDYAFNSCSNLAKVSISQSVVLIVSASFVGISKEAEIEINLICTQCINLPLIQVYISYWQMMMIKAKNVFFIKSKIIIF